MWGALVLACATFGMADAAQKEPDVADLPPEAAQWVFELRVRAVRESDGRPVPHTALRVDGGNEAFGRWQKTITTGADGRAAVRLPTGRYRVYPLADPFAFAWSQSFELDPNTEVTIPLKQACALAGRVVDDRGKPLAGSHVDVWADAGELHLVTDGAGRFRVDRLTEGEHTAHRSTPPAFRPAPRTGAPARVGTARSTIVLHRGATLTVATECDGGPCLGASAIVNTPGGDRLLHDDGRSRRRGRVSRSARGAGHDQRGARPGSAPASWSRRRSNGGWRAARPRR